MEPFGLLNLLSSLLPKAEESPSAAPKNEPEITENSKEKNDDASPQDLPPQTQNNACLEFLDRHDQRVKRTKKQ